MIACAAVHPQTVPCEQHNPITVIVTGVAHLSLGVLPNEATKPCNCDLALDSKSTLRGGAKPRGPELLRGGGHLIAADQGPERRDQQTMLIQEGSPLHEVRREPRAQLGPLLDCSRTPVSSENP